jgi:hypothetical protein
MFVQQVGNKLFDLLVHFNLGGLPSGGQWPFIFVKPSPENIISKFSADFLG